MASVNKVMLLGNLCADPELRYSAGTQPLAVCKLRLAVNEVHGQKKSTLFIDVKAFGKQAENCHQYLSKGRPVFVEGRLAFVQWESRGQKYSRHEVIADRVQFLNGGKKDSTGQQEFGFREEGAQQDPEADTELETAVDNALGLGAGPIPEPVATGLENAKKKAARRGSRASSIESQI